MSWPVASELQRRGACVSRGREDYYWARTTLKVNVLPADIAAAILFFASRNRSGKSTGNIINVDGGVALAYPR